jgi:hypothetical protein
VIFLTKLVAFLTKIIGEILGEKNSTVNLTNFSKFLEIFVKYILYLKIGGKKKKTVWDSGEVGNSIVADPLESADTRREDDLLLRRPLLNSFD